MADSEMVERVAEAIWRQDFANYGREPPCDWATLKRTSREDWHSLRDQARAAIEALREPTEQMKERASYNAAMGHSEVSPALADDVWSWMIDAALERKP